MWKEFKAFVMRGNVLDLAVGVIIGGAFGAISKSLVDNVLMPPLGLITGGVDFADKFAVLKAGKAGAATPDTAPCPYCTMTVSRKATRCPHCTSELGRMPEAASAAAAA